MSFRLGRHFPGGVGAKTWRAGAAPSWALDVTHGDMVLSVCVRGVIDLHRSTTGVTRLDHAQEAKVLQDLRGKEDCQDCSCLAGDQCFCLLPRKLSSFHSVAESKTRLFLVLELCGGGAGTSVAAQIAIHSGQSKPVDQQQAIARVMALLSNFDKVSVLWSNFYTKAEIWEPLLQQKPLLMDPVIFCVNHADPKVFDSRELMRHARSFNFFR
eukprot:s690_g3.t1